MAEHTDLKEIHDVIYKNFVDVEKELEVLAQLSGGRKSRRYKALIDSADKLAKRLIDLAELLKRSGEANDREDGDLIDLWERVQQLEKLLPPEGDKRNLILLKDYQTTKFPLSVTKFSRDRPRRAKIRARRK